MARFDPYPALHPFNPQRADTSSGSRVHYVDEGQGRCCCYWTATRPGHFVQQGAPDVIGAAITQWYSAANAVGGARPQIENAVDG